MSTAAWYKRAVYQFVQSRGCRGGGSGRLRAERKRAGSAAAAVTPRTRPPSEFDPLRLPADAAA